jgi:PAS domain S-box-containing protein
MVNTGENEDVLRLEAYYLWEREGRPTNREQEYWFRAQSARRLASQGGDERGGPRSDELLRLIFDSATDFAIFSTDQSGLVTTWNPGAERLLGYSEEEIIGRSCDIIFTAEDLAAGAAQNERDQAATLGRAEDERWQQRKNGSLFWASGLMMPLADRSGFAKILRDRTEAHRAENLLRESEERFRLLASSIPQLVFLTRPDGNRTWPSPQWIDFTGQGFDSSLGFGWYESIHSEDRTATREAWRSAQESGEYYAEHRVRRSDGIYRWHQTRARPIDQGEEANADWVGTMTDIHDMRAMQDRQQVLLAELQHRTRNLLAVVQAIARQTMRSSTSLGAFSAEFTSRLEALSRVQALLARVDRRDIALNEIVTAELRAHIDELSDQKVKVYGPPVSVPAASAQALALALHELATNAVKYGALLYPEGRLEVRWRVEAGTDQKELVLEWQETGVKMPSERSRQKGYGSELIERALPYQLNARTSLDFTDQGVHCVVRVPSLADSAVTG